MSFVLKSTEIFAPGVRGTFLGGNLLFLFGELSRGHIPFGDLNMAYRTKTVSINLVFVCIFIDFFYCLFIMFISVFGHILHS